ncbi:hypothetical protein BH24BAC1_BH24BAC1_39270 [soil metagenome]
MQPVPWILIQVLKKKRNRRKIWKPIYRLVIWDDLLFLFLPFLFINQSYPFF